MVDTDKVNKTFYIYVKAKIHSQPQPRGHAHHLYINQSCKYGRHMKLYKEMVNGPKSDVLYDTILIIIIIRKSLIILSNCRCLMELIED